MPNQANLTNHDNTIKQIKASAGSGKTHTIINILLALLLNDKKSIKDIFSSVLAITFTNAAAIDMKSKLITRLKNIALDLEPEYQDSARAKESISSLIENYLSLNMRTIDSFLLAILRQNTLESHLPAKFDIQFNKEDFFEPLLDDLAYSALKKDADTANEEVSLLLPFYEKMYDALFYQTNQKGFLGTKKVRTALFEALNLINDLSLEERNLLSSTDVIRAHYNYSFEEFKNNLLKFDELIDAKKTIDAKGNFKHVTMAPYRNALEEFRQFSKLSSFFQADYEELYEKILNKKERASLEKPENLAEYSTLIILLKNISSSYKMAYLLQNALKYTALIDFCKLILELQSYEEFSKACILSERVTELLLENIEEKGLLPTILSRLPYELEFILIDEFQDTNLKQWKVIRAFVLEALSRGGDFTYVGDVKQAIYAFRGGNSSLFEGILEDLNWPCSHQKLETNWRSSKNVIEFNNAIFEQVKDKDFAFELMQRLCKNHENAKEYSEELSKNYDDVKQHVSAKWENGIEGKVALYKIPNSQNNEVLYEDLNPQLVDIVRKATLSYEYKDMAILVRDNTTCSLFAEWLTKENIPVITEGALEIKSNFIVRQCLSFMDFLKDNRNDTALWHVVAYSGLFENGQVFDTFLPVKSNNSNQILNESAQLIKVEDWLECRSRKESLLTCIKQKSPKLYEIINYYIDFAQRKSIYDFLVDLYEKTNLYQRYPQENGFFARFLELSYQAGRRNINTVHSFLKYWNEEGHEEKIPMPENVNAVRILTIHKSKGAEYKFVVVWNEKKDRKLDGLKHYQVDNLSFFAPHSIYHKNYGSDLKIQAFETINLFYVAFTRAKEELHVLYKEMKTNPSLTQMLLESAESVCEYDESDKAFVYSGKRKPEKKLVESYEKKNIDFSKLYARVPVLNMQGLVINKLSEFNAVTRGNIVHYVLEKYFNIAKYKKNCENKIIFDVINKQDLESLVKNELINDLSRIFKWLKSQAEFEYWIQNSKSEQSMLTANGELYRCDLCVETDAEVIVIDFKTGAESDEYQDQIRNYIKILSDIDSSKDKKITGLLLYLDMEKIQKVEA